MDAFRAAPIRLLFSRLAEATLTLAHIELKQPDYVGACALGDKARRAARF